MTNLTAPTQGSSSELTPGAVLGGRFEVGPKFDSDGMARLYGATDRKTGRSVSLRQVRSHLDVSGFASKLRAEVKAASSVKHDHVHDVFGLVGDVPGAPVLVQGPVSGRNLSDYVRSRRQKGAPLSLRGAYNVVAHVARAVEALHVLGPHGALRPSVVWIGGEGEVTLMDFALSRAVLSSSRPEQLGDAVAAYLAPEVKLGKAPGVHSDVFGLGALLYVLLTGRSPAEQFVPPSQAHPDADAQLDAELLKALAADPATRHASPAAFREALLPLMSGLEEATSSDFGVDIDIDINLASIAPSARPSATAGPAARAPKAAPVPQVTGDPQAGMRVSIHEAFRASDPGDLAQQQAADERRSLGAIDLQDVLSKITENDDARWMLVKDGMDHGPFTGKQLVNLIIKGEALAEHGLLNTDTGERRKVKEFREFTEFLGQYELRRKEAEQKAAIEQAETSERRSTLFKVGVGAAIVAVLAMAGGAYLLSRGAAERASLGDEEVGDLYQRGEIEISGSAGILPPPRRGKRHRGARRRGGGGGGGGMSYEQAMMQAVDLGSADRGGGERQLSAATVAGVMNRHLNGIYNACVKGSVGKVRIDLAILGNGQVQGVSVHAGDGAFQKCVASKVRRIRFPSFPAPRMGARYAFDT